VFEALRWRLTGWYVLVFALVFVAVGVIVFVWVDHRLTSEVRGAVSNISTAATERAAQHSDMADADGDVRAVLANASLTGNADVFVLLLNPDGTIAANPSDVATRGLPAVESMQAAARDGVDTRTYNATGDDLSIRTTAVRDPSGRLIGFVQAGKSDAEREASLRTLVIVMGGGAFTGLVLATAGGLFVAAIAIRPVRRSFDRQREFVADASHELRTPLAVIRANAEAAARVSPPDDPITDIAAEASYMTRLLDDLLQLARSDTRGIELQVSSVDVAEVARSGANAVRALLDDAGLRFSVDIDRSSPLRVNADPERIREVLLILLDNALKYTPRGGAITLRAFNEDGQAVVRISDTGIGIAPGDITRLFDRFYRVDKARSRAAGGAGLGLSIAKEIADAHGGTITVESAAGEGTTVTFRLPVAASVPREAQAPS